MRRKEIKNMHHLFTCVDKKELEGTDHLYSIFLFSRNSEDVVQIPDRLIVNDPTFIYGYETYHDSLSDPSCGLSYYGITIIPFASLSVFQQRLKNDRHMRSLKELIKLCSVALDNNLDILHWGI